MRRFKYVKTPKPLNHYLERGNVSRDAGASAVMSMMKRFKRKQDKAARKAAKEAKGD